MKIHENLPLHAYIREYSFKEEYNHLTGTHLPICFVCGTPTSDIVFELNVPYQKIENTWYSAKHVDLCSYEEAIQLLQENDERLELYSCTGKLFEDYLRQPSTCTKDVWISAFCWLNTYPYQTARSGKWLIFLSPETIDKYWLLIQQAVKNGELGDSAKVSTLYGRGTKKLHVICVYTYDYADKEDVFRIREKLRDLGIKKPISYKADVDTHFLRYKNDYSLIYKA